MYKKPCIVKTTGSKNWTYFQWDPRRSKWRFQQAHENCSTWNDTVGQLLQTRFSERLFTIWSNVIESKLMCSFIERNLKNKWELTINIDIKVLQIMFMCHYNNKIVVVIVPCF